MLCLKNIFWLFSMYTSYSWKPLALLTSTVYVEELLKFGLVTFMDTACDSVGMCVDSHTASIIGMSNQRKGMSWAFKLLLPKWASRKYMLPCPETVVWLTGECFALFFRSFGWEVEDKLLQIFCQRRASEPCPEMPGLS